MRFNFANSTHPMTIAKSVKKLLPEQHPSLGKAQETVARLFGWSNWHEFSSNIKNGAEPPVKWDDEVSHEEASSRNIVLIGRLRDILNLGDEAAAAALIEKLRPLGRLKAEVSKAPEWRKRLDDPKYRDRYFGPFSRPITDVINEYKRDLRPGSKTTFLSQLDYEGQSYDLYWERSQDFSEIRGTETRRLLSILVKDEKSVGNINGTIIKGAARGRMSEDAWYQLFDMVDDRTLLIGGQLMRRPDFHKFFAKHRTMVIIHEFSTLRQKWPRGIGIAYMEALAAQLAKIETTIGTVVIDVDPQQYHDMEVNQRTQNRGYVEAAAHLEKYLAGTGVEKAFGNDASLVFTRPARSVTGSARSDAFFMLGEQAARQMGPAGQARFHAGFSEVEGMREIGANMAAMMEFMNPNRIATKTAPGEPDVIGKPGWKPEDFSPMIASAQMSLSPHKDLWKYLPSDLIQIVVIYKTAMATFDRHNVDFSDGPLHKLECTFRNGTMMTLTPEEFIGRKRMMDMPESLVGATGHPVAVNPYTDKYETSLFAAVMKANTLLLFSGKPVSIAWAPGAPMTYTRP
ncbi:hypothetical protein [Rhizobium leguminosarum]|uniref:hypothetical protein n=1 Tax=Rhizobium leguminosarum TaxID=384 RepID=UPI002E15D32C|nr:hypothetical protein U8Q02_41710 [Rhizobium leguminosarum]